MGIFFNAISTDTRARKKDYNFDAAHAKEKQTGS